MNFYEVLILLGIGLLAGSVGGSLGVGGGIVIVPALIFFFGFSQHTAQGTSLAVLMFPVAMIGAYNYYKNGYVEIKHALIILVAFAVGQYLGSLLSVNLPEKTLRSIFGFFVILMGLKMVFGR
jgi:uncharacterized membrane protein YfcA